MKIITYNKRTYTATYGIRNNYLQYPQTVEILGIIETKYFFYIRFYHNGNNRVRESMLNVLNVTMYQCINMRYSGGLLTNLKPSY